MQIANDNLMRLQASLTPRDERLLGWLYDHGVLTTDQIAKALFRSKDFAQRRLLRLVNRRVVSRFRPQRWEGGSYPYHYVLDQLGYEHVMGQRSLGMPGRDYAKRRKQALISKRNLVHLLGVNQLFIDLAACERSCEGSKLVRWRPGSEFHNSGSFYREGSSTQLMMHPHGLPRPDGHGVWIESGRAVPFFAEYDTGTESHNTLAEKISKYELLFSETLVWSWPVLFVFPSIQREFNFQESLGNRRRLITVFGTTSLEYLEASRQAPADPVWLLPGRDPERIRLSELSYDDPENDALWVRQLHALAPGSD